jgi:outer membrane protein assembly factor BamB
MRRVAGRFVRGAALLLAFGVGCEGPSRVPDREKAPPAESERARRPGRNTTAADLTPGEILSATGVKGGLVVHLGCGDGKLTAALRASDAYLVHGLARHAADARKARAHIRSLGLYGKVSVERWSGDGLPYADNLVNLLVAEDPAAPPKDEIMRVLCPDGVAYVKQAGKWTKTVKPRPAALGEWTHWLHGPDGNAVTKDTVVATPRRIQWEAGPRWSRSHELVSSVTAMVSSGGRVFSIVDEAPTCLTGNVPDKWALVARDAMNGVPLWKRPIAEWGWKEWKDDFKGRWNMPVQISKRLVASGDRVYVTLGFHAPLTALDAATGKVIKTYEGTENTDEILHLDGLLVLSINEESRTPSKEDRRPVRKSVCVIDEATGRVLWRKGSYGGLRAKFNSSEPFGRLELTSGGGKVFLVDEREVLCLDLRTGDERWRVPRPEFREHKVMYGIRMSDLCVVVYQDDVLLFAQPEMRKKRSWHTLPGTLHALDAGTGKPMWKHRYGGWSHNWQPDVFVVGGLAWVFEHKELKFRGHETRNKGAIDYALLGLDLKTGELKRRLSTDESFRVAHHHRCHRNKATTRFVLSSRRGVEFLDLQSGENHLNHWARGACVFGVMPCNGLLYLTPHSCDCYIETILNGFCALAPERERPHHQDTKSTKDGEVQGNGTTRVATLGDLGALVVPFEKGPAYATEAPLPVASDTAEWPTYRHDARRTGSTKTPVPAELEPVWRAVVSGRLGGRPSAPVVAGGKVFVSSVDEYRVVALDAADGRTAWDFTAGGRVDTPPTIYRGVALFGSADGWVYCVRASDGKLAWRRRMAPAARRVVSYGRLESAWPVHGSVLMQGGLAYVAAGRSSYLDGGIRVLVLDPVTGKVKRERTIYSPDPETHKMPPGDAKRLPGVLSDVLASDGTGIYMRQMKVFGEEDAGGARVYSSGGFLDDTFFNRTHWSVGDVWHAQLLVCDEASAYGFEVYESKHRWHFFRPGDKGYFIFAGDVRLPPDAAALKKAEMRREKQWGSAKNRWSARVPVRVVAMALAGEVLFAAGTPDVVDANDPLGAFEGRKGGVLVAFAAADGRRLSEIKLAAPPVWDGMAAANGRLYVATTDGRVLCMGTKP